MAILRVAGALEVSLFFFLNDPKYLGVPQGIEVSYFLVCPDDGSQHQWNMPVDWEKNTTVNDHRGEAYCIRIPSEYLKVRRVYWLAILYSRLA